MLFDTIMQIFGKQDAQRRDVLHSKDQDTEGLKAIGGAHILLVEDNEINQQVAEEILAGAGFNVSIANNGLEAVNRVQEKVFDAILMDIQMPVMDGYTATRKIREWQEDRGQTTDDRGQRTEDRGQRTENREQKTESGSYASNLKPQTSDIPIIAMTAHAMTGDHEKSLKAGMVDHVTKPIDPEQLFNTLIKWIAPREPAAGELSSSTASPDAAKPESLATHTVAATSDDLANQDSFPDMLPGFNLKAGLRRLQGNRKLYRKLLLNFSGTYANAIDEIRRAIDSADFENAHQLVHSLKGVAGNLSADELQKATVELEKLVKHRDTNLPPEPESLEAKVALLENALNEALQAVKILKADDEEPTDTIRGDLSAAVPGDLDKEAIGRLRDAAEMGDVTEVLMVADDIASYTDGFEPHRQKIAQLADDFDFDGIIEMAGELENLVDVANS